MPHGKPAGTRCIQLTDDNACAIFGRAERPAVCRQLRPEPAMCGTNARQAMAYLERLERETSPCRALDAGELGTTSVSGETISIRWPGHG